MLKKTMGLVLSVMLIFSCIIFENSIVVYATNMSENDFASKISYLKTVYKNNEYWNGYNACGYEGTGTKKCSCSSSCSASCTDKCGKFYLNGQYYGGQCFGFANKMGYLIFGSVPTASWTYYSSVSEYYAGDYVRVRKNRHSIFITKVSGDTVTYVDCNNAGPCMVKWDRTISVSSLKSITTHVYHYPGNTLKGTGTNGGDDTPTVTVVWEKDSSYPTPFSAYPAATSGKISVYNDNLVAYSQSTRYIAYNDLCKINEVYTNGYCSVTYPTSSGSHTEYAKTSDFIPNSVSRYGYKPTQNLTTYTRSNLSITFGSVFTTDDCTIVGKYGDLLQIIYPVSSGYKLGWIAPPIPPQPSDFPTPLYAYNASSGERTTVYQSLSSMGTYYGQIFVDDKCTLNSVSISGGWINVTYPAGSSTKTGYVYLDQFIPLGSRLSTFYTASVSQQTTTYRKNDMLVSYGYVSVGDTITVVGKSGNKLQVLYPLDTGGYKLAWIYDTYVNKTLKEIYVVSNPSKTIYLEGEGFNSSGLVINAKYTDGSTSNITGLCSLSGYSNTPGTKTINVTYGGKSTAFTVIVNAKSLTKIEITSNPSKTTYDVNEVVNLSGLRVKATFNNDSTAEVSDYYVDAKNATISTGNKTLTVIYSFNDVAKTASFNINVSHNFGDWATSKEASCSENGTQSRKCKGCGYTETKSIVAIGHNYNTKVVQSTCTEQGYTLHICSRCNSSYKDTYTSVLDHNYVNKVIVPTATSQGYTLHTCTVCGDNYKDSYTDYKKPIDSNAPQIVVDSKTANIGGEVVVNISFKNNPGITGFKFNVKYDSNIMILKSSESNGINALYSENITDNPYIISWESGDQDITTNGNLIKLTFTVKDNASEGIYPITVEYDEDEIYNLKEENVRFEVVKGEIKISNHLPGDINDDGKVNMKDLTRLHQYINGWKVVVNESAIDVNGDGKVNMKDLTRLHQYINGWKVEVH